jgi:hypothetical protein
MTSGKGESAESVRLSPYPVVVTRLRRFWTVMAALTGPNVTAYGSYTGLGQE